MFGVDECTMSDVDCKMLYVFLVTIDGDKICKSDDSWNCVSGIICFSGIIVVLSAIGFLWFCGVWILF